jgi:EAL domain-containing protein (putative c-di-GMP-specific phosphodiesterase class I)/cellulose synthase/poly-beta-1,6-N-acetylglucosamine synthase-like glycosyltransferase
MKDRLITGGKREIGSDTRRHPMSPVPTGLPESRILTGRLAIVITVGGWIGYLVWWFYTQFLAQGAYTTQAKFEAIVYLAVVTLLMYSSLAYLVSRLGFIYRAKEHRRVPRAQIEEFFQNRKPTLTVIIPSYREETRVIRSTILSAALQEYPNKKIVLLVDDPPNPDSPKNKALLEGALRLPKDIESLFAYPFEVVESAYREFKEDIDCGGGNRQEGGANYYYPTPLNDQAEPTNYLRRLAETYEFAVSWLQLQAESLPIVDHTDVFLKEQVFERLAADFSLVGAALRQADTENRVRDADSVSFLDLDRIDQLFQRLVNVFRVRVEVFQRKEYASLSHEPNKAMNLNSYIGLMGGAYKKVTTLSGTVLVPTEADLADLIVENPDYVLTLDADSTLLPEYCLRLVYLLEQDAYAHCGIAQTPYSAYPGSNTRLERIAGATTDLQHIVHQGLTYYNSSFWVGANAIIRKKALDDVEETTYEGGYPVKRYIRDRTAIEDTESSIDMATKGWEIFNYPERLSYSATPPDFGALAIQRRRWADGGLLIVPKLRRKYKHARELGLKRSFAEFYLRFNYLASITWTSLALIVLLVFPFANELVTPLIALLALPYFFAMSTDLKYCGYRRSDVFRIYGFNLILIPVNLAGTASSLVQAITGEHGAFARTPKVRKRTVTPLAFVVMPYLLIALTIYTLIHDYYHAVWNNVPFAIINLALTSYAILAYIGIKNSVQDIFVQVLPWFKKKPRKDKVLVVPPSQLIDKPEVRNWEAVLHFGTTEEIGTRYGSIPSPSKLGGANKVGARQLRNSATNKFDDQIALPMAPLPRLQTLIQPVFDLFNGGTVGYEVLNRIDGGSPLKYLSGAPLAEALLVEKVMIGNAMEIAQRMHGDYWLGLNLSQRYIARQGYDLGDIGNPHREIYLEISCRREEGRDDTQFLHDLLAQVPVGCRIAVDDVEPEHRNMRLLERAAPAMMKIDTDWISGIAEDRIRQSLVEIAVRFAKKYGIKLVAEGIENERDLKTLQLLGVDYGQGYLLGRPRPAEELLDLD